MKTTFILSKDPRFESTGDLTMAQLVMDLAREAHQVQVLCLSAHPDATDGGYRRVAKPHPRAIPIVAGSLLRRRSLVHTRFLSGELVDAVRATSTDLFVADHSYMAECVLAAFGSGAKDFLAVNTVVPESLIWTGTRGLAGRIDSPRIIRDETRVALAARSVASYDKQEADHYRSLGIERSYWLDLTLPPARRVPVEATPPRLLFLGDRRWAPNQEAFFQLLQWWPRIADGIAGAELCIVGAADPDQPAPRLPAGVRELGFVEDLDGFLAGCRALAAPIRTGGGVRVKILDAVSRGLPVIGTGPAVGSLGELLGIASIDDPGEFIDRCRNYLLDRGAAAGYGARLYEIGADRWQNRLPHKTVDEWLR